MVFLRPENQRKSIDLWFSGLKLCITLAIGTVQIVGEVADVTRNHRCYIWLAVDVCLVILQKCGHNACCGLSDLKLVYFYLYIKENLLIFASERKTSRLWNEGHV